MAKQLLKSGGNILRTGSNGFVFYEAPTPTFTLRDNFDGSPGSTTTWGDAVSLARYTPSVNNNDYDTLVVSDELKLATNFVDFGGHYGYNIGNAYDGDFTFTVKARHENASFPSGEGIFLSIGWTPSVDDPETGPFISRENKSGVGDSLHSYPSPVLPFTATSYYLRITRVGTYTECLYSTDGINYTALSTNNYYPPVPWKFYIYGYAVGLPVPSTYEEYIDYIEIITNEDIEA